MIELRHLRTLATLAESGSLTAAAGRLHLTQSALSHQLRELEDRLGLVLVNRSARPLGMTRAGDTLLSLARQVLPQVESALAELGALGSGEAGRLYIATECHSCMDWLLPRLRAYQARFPGIELDVAHGPSADLLSRLLAGSVDVVLTPDRRELAGLAWRPLFDYELRLVVAPGHPLARHAVVRPEDLAGETLLAYPVERQRLDVFSRFLWPAGVEPARLRTVDNTGLLLELAALSQGVAVLPDWICAPALAAGRVASLRLGEAGLTGCLHGVMRAGEQDYPHLAGFLESA